MNLVLDADMFLKMPARRSQYIVTFNSSPHYRVMIMETKVAAHGLNVTSASRVVCMNACWQRSVERQAIKRAHRIGQTREVYVETLVLKDTIEVSLPPPQPSPRASLASPPSMFFRD
jgi:SNF2 family DNA or RNA helicase